jgi:NAD(P)-dependent dehydrogenase (short-subunit alcohol dehydrogenase family)
MQQLLEGKVVLVMGAGSCGPGWGNGKAAAVAYAREGAKVVAVDLNLERAQETESIILKEGGQCASLAGDVSSESDVRAIADKAIGQWGRIDVLHNNVGIAKLGDPVELDSADWDIVMDVNLKSAYLACKNILPYMLKQGSGVITNISSVASLRVLSGAMLTYNVSKAALNNLTQTVAIGYASRGIRANAILPGLMDTPMIYDVEEYVEMFGGKEKFVASRHAMCPTKKMGDAWDVANAAVFLASDRAKYINGVLLPVDGGLNLAQ